MCVGGGGVVDVDLTRVSIIFKLLMLMFCKHCNNDRGRLDSSFCGWIASGLSRRRS